MKSIIDFAHELLKETITQEDVTIDMTVGNGFDTLFLVKNSHFVYGFDIQKEACENTVNKLKGYDNFKIIQDSHLNFLNYVNSFKGVIFNLGYLPKGDKLIHTDATTTIQTLKLVLQNIQDGGICVIVIYPGHDEGSNESILLTNLLKTLNQKQFDVIRYEFINQINNPPYLMAVRKRL